MLRSESAVNSTLTQSLKHIEALLIKWTHVLQTYKSKLFTLYGNFRDWNKSNQASKSL